MAAVIWGIQAWQRSRWRGVLILFAPTFLIAAVFTLIYPQWIVAALGARNQPAATSVNLWPWLLPVAVGCLAYAVVKLRPAWAALATNLAVPYFRIHIYIGALALIAADIPWLGAVAVLGSWVYFFVAYVGVLRR